MKALFAVKLLCMPSLSHFHTVNQDKTPQLLKLIVEISKNDSCKYEYNHELGILELDRILSSPIYYPVNYCDAPQTWNVHDNDPLDALVLTSPLQPGILVTGRVIGMLEMIDNGEIDHKIICVANADPRYKEVNDIEDLREFEKKDIQTFMETYKYVQTGPGTVDVKGFVGKEKAYKVIEESLRAYKEKFKIA